MMDANEVRCWLEQYRDGWSPEARDTILHQFLDALAGSKTTTASDASTTVVSVAPAAPLPPLFTDAELREMSPRQIEHFARRAIQSHFDRTIAEQGQRIVELSDGNAKLFVKLELAERRAAEAEKDAGRYRKLRNADPDEGPAVSEPYQNDWGNWKTRYFSGDGLDAALDALRAEGSGK